MIEEKKEEETQKEKNLWWRPFWTSYFSPDELFEEAMKYFQHCDDTKVMNWYWKEVWKPKTLTWLAKWLWVAKDYISEKLKDESYSEMIKYIRSVVENDIEEKAMLWVYNSTIASKNLSANFNWVDKSQVDNNHSGSLSINNILQDIQWLNKNK